jgi:hypothetical protein
VHGYEIDTDAKGYPVIRSSAGPSLPTEPRELRLGVEIFHLTDENGRVLSPTVSLNELLLGGQITENQFSRIASYFDDPETIHYAARQLGVIREKRDDGSIVLRLPHEHERSKRGPSKEQHGLTEDGDPIVATSRDQAVATPVPLTSQGNPVSAADSGLFHDHVNAADRDVMTFKAAAKLLAEHGISIIGRLKIYRDRNKPKSRERYVKLSDVKRTLIQRRGGTSAADLIDEAIQEAQRQLPRDRYSGRPMGASEVARQTVSRAALSPAQERDRANARRRREQVSARRREATARRRRGS